MQFGRWGHHRVGERARLDGTGLDGRAVIDRHPADDEQLDGFDGLDGLDGGAAGFVAGQQSRDHRRDAVPRIARHPIDWQAVENHPQLEVGTLAVPVDYSDSSLGTFHLFMARRLANDQGRKIGTLLVNPGGPGAGGAEFAASAD